MAWGTPLTAVSNAALTAAQWNASVRDNLNETAVAKMTTANQYFVGTGLTAGAARTPAISSNTSAESTTSTSYADLTAGTAGPSVTVTSGTKALVSIQALLTAAATGLEAKASYVVSGASTIAAADENAIRFQLPSTLTRMRCGGIDFPSLTAGSNTIKMVYALQSAGTATYDDRTIVVLPF